MYTRPHFEHKVSQYCEERQIEVFLPTYKSWRRWSDRKKIVALPLFPSYVFVRLRTGQRQRATQAPGFLWFVRNRQEPARVDEEELEAIRRLLASGLEFDPLPGVQIGTAVEVVSGALAGCRGMLVRKDKTLVLQMSAIQGAVRVRLPDPSFVRPLAGRRKIAVPASHE